MTQKPILPMESTKKAIQLARERAVEKVYVSEKSSRSFTVTPRDGKFVIKPKTQR